MCRTFISTTVNPPAFREMHVIVVGLHSDISLLCRTVISSPVTPPDFAEKLLPPLHIGHSVLKIDPPPLEPRFWEPEGAGVGYPARNSVISLQGELRRTEEFRGGVSFTPDRLGPEVGLDDDDDGNVTVEQVGIDFGLWGSPGGGGE